MKHRSTFILLFASVAGAAQVPPPPPPARPTPPAPPAPAVRPAPAPRPSLLPFDVEDRVRELQERAVERALEATQRAQERTFEATQRAQELQERSVERAAQAAQRAMEMQERRFFDWRFELPPLPPLPPVPSFDTRLFYGHAGAGELPPAPWAQGDPADSLYRAAHQALSRGDYRKAAAIFKEIPQKHQYSAYAADALYWQAHSLYRIGGSPDLQEALGVLEALKQKYPGTRMRSEQDVSELQTRVAGVLSSRGLGGQDIVKRALSQSANSCDRDEQSVRATALSALMETDPDAAASLAQKMLARKDDCSVQLRKNAVMIASRKRDAQTLATLAGVAKSDPSSEVRQSAVRYLASMPGDDALAALEDLLKSSDDERVQREAVRALTTHSSPRARQAARAIIERNDAPETLRISALQAYDRERSTTDDANWLRSIYPKVENPRVRSYVISAITRIGGDGMDQWFLALAKNEDEPLEARENAVRRAGQSMDIASLGKFYDNVAQGRLRRSIIDMLGNRREPEAIDKLGDIAKNGTDPQLRNQAIYALTGKKDPRATKLLLDLIDERKKP